MSTAALPRRPLFDLSWLRRSQPAGLPSIGDLPHLQLLSSGRAALTQALRQLRGDRRIEVLVPSFHCPTMVAPVFLAGMKPRFYALGPNGMPRIEQLPTSARALIHVHLFGLSQSLASIREWCDRHGVALIEDCAHALFGQAGERPVGAWGDYATASLTKFLPVPEAGLLASRDHSLRPLNLRAPGPRAELKAWVDLLEEAALYERFPVVANALLGWRARRAQRQRTEALPHQVPEPTEAAWISLSDMARVDQAPTVAARWLARLQPRVFDVERRRKHFDCYSLHLDALPGAGRPPALPAQGAAPYAYPLWVRDPAQAEAVYQVARSMQLPVYRWDRVWPGCPVLPDDVGRLWQRQLLQLLCHPSLHPDQVQQVAQRLALQLSS